MWKPTATIGKRIASSLDDLTEHWIGWTFPPVERAFVDSGWEPDATEHYCQRCGDSVGEGEKSAGGCATCGEGAELDGGIGDGVLRLGSYIEPLRGWIQAIKYQRWHEMGEALGRTLGERVRCSGIIDPNEAIVVPLPMPWQRRIYRGIDHAAVIAHSIAHEIEAPVARILVRANMPPQVSLTPSERKRAGSRGMRIRPRWQAGRAGWLNAASFDGAHFVLVDDVRTTGSTLQAAARLLRRLKPARIICAVAAVSDSASRRARQASRSLHETASNRPDRDSADSANHAAGSVSPRAGVDESR